MALFFWKVSDCVCGALSSVRALLQNDSRILLVPGDPWYVGDIF